MILYELIKKYNWNDIFLSRKFEYYKDYLKNEKGYQKVFEELKTYRPKPSKGFIIITKRFDEFDKKNYLDVKGKYYDRDLKKNEFGFIDKYFALDFIDWEIVIGMEIHPKTLLKYTELAILVHCLYEITYHGFGKEHAPTLWDDIMRKVVMDKREKNLKYAAFICHASEEKDIVRSLVTWIENKGYKVWYDGLEIKIGDSIRQSIDKGLVKAKYGIIIFSDSFFAKKWTQYELNRLVDAATSEDKIILPILHNITYDDMIKHSPSMANLHALSTNDYSIQEIAYRLIEIFDNDKSLNSTLLN